MSPLRPRRYRSLLASYADTKRRRFLGELADLEEEVHLARTQARDTLDKFSIQQMVGGARGARGGPGCGVSARRPRGPTAEACLPTERVSLPVCGPSLFPGQVEDKLAWVKEQDTFAERTRRAPEILVRLRSHTVWERMTVKLCFTVQGFPTPVVQW